MKFTAVARENPHEISFTPDRRTLILTFRRPPELADGLKPDPHQPLQVRYEVREHSRRSLRVFLVQPPEARRTHQGRLVVWDLVLFGRDTYRWRQTDWPTGEYTRQVVRCDRQ